MSLEQIAGLALALGAGGALGGLAALVLSGSRLARDVQAFGPALAAFLQGKPKPNRQELLAAYQELEAAAAAFAASLAKMRRLVPWK